MNDNEKYLTEQEVDQKIRQHEDVMMKWGWLVGVIWMIVTVLAVKFLGS
jgi:hypothetical protein